MKPAAPKGRVGRPKLVNPTANATFKPKKSDRPVIVSKNDALKKQIDRVRKSIERLEKSVPDAPALARAKQFMAMHGMTKINQTRWINTMTQLQEYKHFLNKFESYKTHTVKGAKSARDNQLTKLGQIMADAGWDPDTYSVEDFYNQLNKIDIYSIMRDYGVTSGKVIEANTVVMNTKGGKQATAYDILTEIFGSPVITKRKAAQYTKGTKSHERYKKKRSGK